ncbi:MAG: hypothetical protein KY467_12185 [Gemmatimonadetes bacterium]|nr:hypothetical protein [Gemmatimonadota bacterium]
MFEHTSRYYGLETALHTLPDGRQVAYVRRRLVPPAGSHALLAEVPVAQGDRMDLVTARALGDPLQFWRVADANDAMYPPDLVREPGRLLRIPLP